MLRRSPTATPKPSAQDGRSVPGPSTNSPITHFLTRPAKWFSRSASSSGVAEGTEKRKHKISRPTDPRPILDGYAGSNARSVMDLTTRPPNSLDISQPPSSPSTPIASTNGLGDLRSISRKTWSRSADDLSNLSYSPVSPAFQERVAQYRGRSNSNTAPQPFPTSPQPFPSTEPQSPRAPAVTVSPPEAPLHVHTRSHSFGPKLASKRAIPPSPKRKGSGPPSVPLPSSMLDTPAPEPKRASQIVHNTGYVFLAKAWKPYKLEMKGPKLYFYKPPGERSAQLRGMFPTGIEDEEEEALPPPSPDWLYGIASWTSWGGCQRITSRGIFQGVEFLRPGLVAIYDENHWDVDPYDPILLCFETMSDIRRIRLTFHHTLLTDLVVNLRGMDRAARNLHSISLAVIFDAKQANLSVLDALDAAFDHGMYPALALVSFTMLLDLNDDMYDSDDPDTIDFKHAVDEPFHNIQKGCSSKEQLQTLSSAHHTFKFECGVIPKLEDAGLADIEQDADEAKVGGVMANFGPGWARRGSADGGVDVNVLTTCPLSSCPDAHLDASVEKNFPA
ncbi:hypothetical protein BDZ89DRAFT_1214730 [Hymenopellis radicata]|nr:hypothetical protein BDZ89DRAFT_1214730 [Hymenopellis radicata]